LVARREMFGDEVTRLLERANLRAPVIDYNDEATWPKI
jgi:hypothetical protein